MRKASVGAVASARRVAENTKLWHLAESLGGVESLIAYPKLSWAGEVLAAVENGPLWATRFHPETSGEAGAGVLRNWIAQLG